MDSELAAYLDRVVDRLRAYEAVWLIGSAATGAYVPGVSDVDVVGVAAGPLSGDEKRAIATDLSHERLPCPARKLELPIYTRASLERPAAGIVPDLNLNTGAEEHSVAISDSFWFVLDLAMARDQGRALHGRPPRELLGEVPRDVALDALWRSLDWHDHNVPATASAVLNACRALYYARERSWAGKREAGEWALTRVPEPEVVERALSLHAGLAGPAIERGGFTRSLAAIRRDLH